MSIPMPGGQSASQAPGRKLLAADADYTLRTSGSGDVTAAAAAAGTHKVRLSVTVCVHRCCLQCSHLLASQLPAC